jgi:hypothetical protein
MPCLCCPLGRTDYGNVPHEQIQEELVDLLNGGTKNTEVIQILRMISDSGWKGLVVVEMRPGEIEKLLGKRSFQQLSQQACQCETDEKIRCTI